MRSAAQSHRVNLDLNPDQLAATHVRKVGNESGFVTGTDQAM